MYRLFLSLPLLPFFPSCLLIVSRRVPPAHRGPVRLPRPLDFGPTPPADRRRSLRSPDMPAASGRILTVNGGSSSIKFAAFAPGDPPHLLFTGQIERIGQPGTILRA